MVMLTVSYYIWSKDHNYIPNRKMITIGQAAINSISADTHLMVINYTVSGNGGI